MADTEHRYNEIIDGLPWYQAAEKYYRGPDDFPIAAEKPETGNQLLDAPHANITIRDYCERICNSPNNKNCPSQTHYYGGRNKAEVLNRLTATQQAIVVLYYFDGLTLDQVAGRQNMSRRTVSRELKKVEKTIGFKPEMFWEGQQ